MQQHQPVPKEYRASQGVSSRGQVQGYQSVIDQGGLMEHLAPILLLGLVILAARWLSRKPRREGHGRSANY